MLNRFAALRVDSIVFVQLMKAKKGSGAAALAKAKKAEEDAAKAKAAASKQALKARLAAFQ